MKSFSRKLLYAIAALLFFILSFFILYLAVQPTGDVIEKGWTIQSSGEEIPIQLPYQKSINGLETIAFSNKIHYSSGDALVFTWLRGQAVEILLNERTIFKIGNPDEPTANIWNDTFLVYLPEPESDDNTLIIKLTSASFPISFSIPPYILNFFEAQKKIAIIDLVYNDLLLVSIGSSLLIGFILILLSLILKKGWSAEVFSGLASILGAIESYDYIFRISTGSLGTFLIVKKILMISGYLGILIFVAGLEKYNSNKLTISRYLAVPTCLLIVFIALQTDLVMFSNLLLVFNIVMLLDLVIAIAMILVGKRGKNWLVIPAVWLILGLVQLIIIQVFGIAWPYVLQYIILLSTVIFGLNLLIEFNHIYSEKLDLEKRIDLDTLTAAYNRNVLGKAISDQYDVLILMDLDNFKSYNDHYGHQQGDQLLIKFTEIVKSNLRQQDLLVRYGGDEFLVLLNEISIIDAEHVAMRIRNQFEEFGKRENLSVSYGIEKIAHSLDSDLNKADRLMYAMKHAKNFRDRNNKNKEQD